MSETSERNEKVVTIFRNLHCRKSLDLIRELEITNIDEDSLQVINISDSPDISTFFRVHHSPTVLLFEEGEEVLRYSDDTISTKIILDTIVAFLKR